VEELLEHTVECCTELGPRSIGIGSVLKIADGICSWEEGGTMRLLGPRGWAKQVAISEDNDPYCEFLK